ncbi:unnamed protein product [Mesocestoides corti]|uniref:Amiloride-sensitive sodium channel n=1 Tax=Mesocestoides corti TaxID=53468 RepID=A0A0R3UJP0_MESCO|nr:unnamed protein product [Mesocestoides corti]
MGRVKFRQKSNACGYGWFQRVKANVVLFLESTSIRGCSRIVRSENKIMRCMWAAYLCFTTLFLYFSIFKLVNEYMEYAVNIQTYNNMDAPMDFPTVTFCNHQPFSAQAYQLWRNKTVISPTRFNELLRGRAAELLEKSIEIPKNDSERVRLLNPELLLETLIQGMVYDTLPLYYQSLLWPWHLKLGHSPKDLIALCLFRYGGSWAVAGPGCEDSALRIRRQSDPKFFNCFSIEVVKEFSQHVNELGLILWLGPDENFGKEDRQAFLFDLFEQAYGLRVSIHEPGQIANLDRYSFQVAPGRMNELTFQTVQSIHNNRPTKPCFHNPRQKFADLDERFDYQFELCLNTRLQEMIVKKCGCMFAYYPRIHLPNISLPYCGQLIDHSMKLLDKVIVDRRKECAQKIVGNAAVYRKDIEDRGVCVIRCVSTDYESQVSVTTWRPTGWQLYWSQKTSSLFDAALNGTLRPAEARLIQHFLKASNLTEMDGSMNPIVFNERYTYLIVKRKSNDTIVREENLVLTVNALFSRIGGLCSLYIGLTLAVFMEIVEFIYLACRKRKLAPTQAAEDPTEEIDSPPQAPAVENHVQKR